MALQNSSPAENVDIFFFKSVICLISVGVDNYETVRHMLSESVDFRTRS